MILTLWAFIIFLGISGYLMGTDYFWGSEAVEEIHGFLADSLMPLIALHVASALIMSHLGKSQLVRAMFTGRKNVPDDVFKHEISDNRA